MAAVFWIGGGTGAGKSTVAAVLAERHSLERYDYDWHDARDHSERSHPDRHPFRAAFLARSMDERWVLSTPQEMADSTIGQFAERFEMVLEDLAALDAPRVVARRLRPAARARRAASRLPPARGLPAADPGRRERNYARRDWAGIDGTSDQARASRNKLDRDALLTEHVRHTASALGLATCELDGSEALDHVIATVERQFGLAG